MNHIETLLNREIGLNASSIGASAIDAAVKARLRDTGTEQVSEYVNRLQHDAVERRALIEEIVVSETWFFRDEEVFRAFGRCARKWLRGDRPLRILSLPCATGEEAYSLAMTVLELGYRSNRFAIRGVDVSARAIEHARHGVYGRSSFRGAARTSTSGYFEATEGGARVVDSAREAVAFSLGNVLDATSFAPRSFEVVFCRNLLIYLDATARARALDNLATWLTDDGVLFAGHAEAIERMGRPFTRLQEAAPFGYAKATRNALDEQRPANRVSSRVNGVPSRVPLPSGRVERKEPMPVSAASGPLAPRPSLDRAMELANAGNLGDARRVCEQVIAEVGASADAYCLLGVIANAAGDREAAIQAFNKSLYLNQSHYEALVHLALLHEQRGESRAAANFRRRAEHARKDDGK